MTITIQLSDEQAAALQARAADEGLSVDAWLQKLAEQYAQGGRSPEQATARPVWEIFSEKMKSVPAEVFGVLPQDGASQHDHYLYGSPKRKP